MLGRTVLHRVGLIVVYVLLVGALYDMCDQPEDAQQAYMKARENGLADRYDYWKGDALYSDSGGCAVTCVCVGLLGRALDSIR